MHVRTPCDAAGKQAQPGERLLGWGEMKGEGDRGGLRTLSLSRRRGVTEVDSQWDVGAVRRSRGWGREGRGVCVCVCDCGWARARSVLVFLPCHIVLGCSQARLLSTPLWTAQHTQHTLTHTHTYTQRFKFTRTHSTFTSVHTHTQVLISQEEHKDIQSKRAPVEVWQTPGECWTSQLYLHPSILAALCPSCRCFHHKGTFISCPLFFFPSQMCNWTNMWKKDKSEPNEVCLSQKTV